MYSSDGDREDNDSQPDPESMNAHSVLDHGPDYKLAGRTAEHSNTLRDANCRREVACGESVRGEVDGARERKS